jgi:transcriptional antiterminator NusG
MEWFALTVKPQHEKTVTAALSAKSLEAYTPLYRSRRRWSDRVKTVELPLFPRYVFCRFRFEDRIAVLRIPSITSIVGFGGTPSPISDNEIEMVRLVVSSGLPVTPWPFLRIGHRVRIRDGPLSGLEGILTKEKAPYRVIVNIEILKRAVAVEIDRDLLDSLVDARKMSSQASCLQ